MTLSVRIIDHEVINVNKKKFIEFKIKSSYQKNVSIIYRRYKDFKSLKMDIKKQFPKFKFQFPGKIFFGNFKKKLIEERKKSLQQFLDLVVRHHHASQSQVFQKFTGLDIDQRIKSMKRQLFRDQKKCVRQLVIQIDSELQIKHKILQQQLKQLLFSRSIQVKYDLQTYLKLIKQLHIEDTENVRKLYQLMVNDEEKHLSFQDIFLYLNLFSSGSTDHKLFLLFSLFDQDEQNIISKEDVSNIVHQLLSFVYHYQDPEECESEAIQIIDGFFVDIGVNNKKTLTFEEFEENSRRTGLINVFTLGYKEVRDPDFYVGSDVEDEDLSIVTNTNIIESKKYDASDSESESSEIEFEYEN
ncbi:sorting nexin [Anaeramoeba flamelloides]|uniref:Sorting nexin n=1 Tax=Anaeramoeba flamelloides TaxID=1746091 RepID=A0ABQ8YSV1_9EUKA|nr:sorting nexin [Anaeramoeba flamelloides]